MKLQGSFFDIQEKVFICIRTTNEELKKMKNNTFLILENIPFLEKMYWIEETILKNVRLKGAKLVLSDNMYDMEIEENFF